MAQSTVALPAFLAVISVVIFVLNGELLQFLQTGTAKAVPPLVNVWACHIAGVALLPWAKPGYLKIRETMGLAEFIACITVLSALLLGYNSAWVFASQDLNIAVLNGVFQTSVGTTYLASVLFLSGSTFSLGKTLGVALGLVGAVVVCGAGPGSSPDHQRGMTFACLAVAGNTCYQILFKRWFGSSYDPQIALSFLAAVSVVHVVLGVPVLVAVGTGVEVSDLWQVGVTGVVAYLVQGLWVLVIMLGSPLLLSCALGLTIPVSVAADYVLHHDLVTPMEGAGHILLILAFLIIVSNQDAPAKKVMLIDMYHTSKTAYVRL